MPKEHYYEVSVKWTEGRKGNLTSEALSTAIEVATPPEFMKGVEGVWSPEHLFVAAVNACLMTTFLARAENSKLQYLAFTSKAIGKLELRDGKYLMSEVRLMPAVMVTSEQDVQKALKILEKSEAACLISNSISSAVVLEPTVTVVAEPTLFKAG